MFYLTFNFTRSSVVIFRTTNHNITKHPQYTLMSNREVRFFLQKLFNKQISSSLLIGIFLSSIVFKKFKYLY